jgi:porin
MPHHCVQCVRDILAVTATLLMLAGRPAVALELAEGLNLHGVLAGSLQCQRLSETAGADDRCRGVVPFQPEIEYTPAPSSTLYARLGFARSNGLNAASPFRLAPWIADHEDDVRDINGRDRDHLLNAWYRHSFSLPDDGAFNITLGIISASDYLDENAYSNDEFTQFMNQVLVNAPHALLPAYDAGAALEWQSGGIALRGVYMNIGENDDGNGFGFYGLQIGYTAHTALGEGTYRVMVDTTTEDFLDSQGRSPERRRTVLMSFDQQLGETLGAFVRLGWQDDAAAIDYEWLYSGGLDIRGTSWRRPSDNIGVAYGYLDGGNLDVRRTHVAEAYYRLVINEFLSLTADLQYMNDRLREVDGPEGMLFGLRTTLEF